MLVSRYSILETRFSKVETRASKLGTRFSKTGGSRSRFEFRVETVNLPSTRVLWMTEMTSALCWLSWRPFFIKWLFRGADWLSSFVYLLGYHSGRCQVGVKQEAPRYWLEFLGLLGWSSKWSLGVLTWLLASVSSSCRRTLGMRSSSM